jgi:hypothetical protein
MENWGWTNEKMNEMQEKAYQVCKRLFSLYIKNYKKAVNGDGVYYHDIAEDYRKQYQGACDVYEDTFEMEFYLRSEDRKKILGNMGYSDHSDFAEIECETVLAE